MKNAKGFTLLEVIIAMAIMVIAFASILAVEGGAINASARAKQLNTVAMLARNQMVDMEYKIEGKSFDELEKEESGKFEPPYEDYSWKRTVQELKFPNFSSSFGSAGGTSGGAAGQSNDQSSGSSSGSSNTAGGMQDLIVKQISSFLSKSIREITVTITWKRGKGEQNYSVGMYWVDLNNDFNFSE